MYHRNQFAVVMVDPRAKALQRVDRDIHTAMLQASDYLPRPLESAWKDMRRRRQRYWGNLIAKISELRDAGVPKYLVEMIPDCLRAFIDDLYAEVRA